MGGSRRELSKLKSKSVEGEAEGASQGVGESDAWKGFRFRELEGPP